MILQKIAALLRQRTFLGIATASKNGEPHSATKFLLKIEDGTVYLVDYAIARTVENIRENPRASMSFMDLENLEGYRMSGPVSIIESGEEHDKILKEFEKMLIKLSATRLIEGMKSGKQNEHYELEIPNKVIILKVKVEEVIRIGRQGELFKEKT